MTEVKNRLLFIEDGFILSESLMAGFSKNDETYEMVSVRTVSEALLKIAAENFTAVILSSCNNSIDPVSACAEIVLKKADAALIVVCEPAGEKAASDSLDAGAASYVIKTENCEKLLLKFLKHISSVKRYSDSQKSNTSEIELIKKEIKKVDHIKNELTENLCHELRTPLSSIRGYTELILKDKMGEISPKQRNALTVVLKNADKLLVLIDELSEFSKIQHYKNSSNIRKIDLINVIQESVAALASKSIEKKVSIDFMQPGRAFYINGDYSQMSYVFSTLINSAIKLNTENSKIGVSVEHTDTDISITVPGTSIVAETSDIKTVLEHFFANEVPSQRQLAGLSMEFAMAAEIIRLHGGSVAVTEDGGLVNALKVRLPLYLEVDISHLNQPAKTSGSGKKKILITDDDADCVNLLSAILENDYNLVVTNSAFSMFKALEEHKDFAMILLDINMVDLDGISICRALKEKPEYSAIPILMVSASMQESKKRMSLEAGAMGFLEKPFEAETISGFIKSVI